MTNLSRRDFLKVLGVGSASAAAALALAGCANETATSTTTGGTTSGSTTSGGATSGSTTSGGTTSGGTTTGSTTEAPYEVKMTLPYILTAPGLPAVQQTEDTINDYLLNTLGITEYKLKLTVLSMPDNNTMVPMSLAAKEELDIISVGGSVATFVSNGYLLPLDSYLENELKEAHDIVKDFMICYHINGAYYALPSWSGQVIDYRFIYNKDMVDAAHIDMSDVDTWDKVLDVLDTLKVVYPDEHFLCYSSTFPAVYAMYDHTNTVGSYAATIGEDPTLHNYYATTAYRLACEKAYELNQRGMLDPEGTSNTNGHDLLTNTGANKGVIMGHSLTEESVAQMFNDNNTYGATFGAVTFGRTDMPNARFSYGIPYTSGNPSAAAKFLNLIWTDPFIFNTLGFGTEGIDYVKTDDPRIIEYPEGLGQMTVPYNCIYALAGLGNQRMIWQAPGGTTQADLELIDEQMTNCFVPPAFGFTPVTDAVSNQVAAVSNVVSQYNKALTYGEVDPAEYLPQFLAELETAGMGDIITDFQAQFDEWRKNK